mmetsp:Transcript_79347/g.128570  ORF Transcript_79347/g.128570 Transcript_79347/m.128570 type:complete len:323 (+) Transcript_79347:764-1732(+)
MLCACHVIHAAQHRVRVPVDDAIGGFAVGTRLGATAHNVIRVVPRAHPLEQLIFVKMCAVFATATKLWPGHWPQPTEALVRRVGVLLPGVRIGILLAHARELAALLVSADRVLFLAAGQQRPGVGALPAIDLIPAAAMGRDGLLQIADPQLTVNGGVAPEQTSTGGLGTKPLVDRDIHRLPRRKIVESDRVHIGRVARHLLQALRLDEQLLDSTIEFSQRRDGREQPAVANSTLGDIRGVHVSDNLQTRDVCASLPTPGAEWHVLVVVKQMTLECEVVGDRVLDGGEVDVGLQRLKLVDLSRHPPVGGAASWHVALCACAGD